VAGLAAQRLHIGSGIPDIKNDLLIFLFYAWGAGRPFAFRGRSCPEEADCATFRGFLKVGVDAAGGGKTGDRRNVPHFFAGGNW
jgi:hypothetical protein